MVECTAFTSHDAAGNLLGAAVVATLGDVGTVLQIEGPADVQEQLVRHAIRALNIDTLAVPPDASHIDLEPAFARLAPGAPYKEHNVLAVPK